MIRILSIVLMLGVASVPCGADNGPNAFRGQDAILRESLGRRDFEQAISTLLEMAKNGPELFRVNNYDYLLARLEEQTGNSSIALPLYQSVAARDSVLSGYALWHMSQIARSGGNLAAERESLRRIFSTDPGKMLVASAQKRIAVSQFESGDFQGAISSLSATTLTSIPGWERERSIYLATALNKIGEAQKAREIFTRIETTLPRTGPDDFALAAVRALDEMDGSKSVSKTAVDESEHLRRAGIYHFNRDFDGARLHYKVVATSQSSMAATAIYQTARTYYQERKFGESIEGFNRIIAGFPESPDLRDAFGFKASALARMGRFDDSIAAYKEDISRFPNGPGSERPYLNIVDTLRDAHRNAEALEWARITEEKFQGQLPALLAQFSSARIHIADGDWRDALSELDQLLPKADNIGLSVAGGTNKLEVSFLRAFALEQLGQFDQAIDAYLSISDGRDQYYGQRATARLGGLSNNARVNPLFESRKATFLKTAEQSLQARRYEDARVAAQYALRFPSDLALRNRLLDILRSCYRELSAYRIELPQTTAPIRDLRTSEARESGSSSAVGELLFLGVYDEAMSEIAGEQTSKGSGSGIASGQGWQGLNGYQLADLALKGDRADLAVQYAEPAWKKIPSDFVLELAPRRFVELLYPTPFREQLLNEAKPRGVDPRFVLSIARQESRFRTDAKSAAAARGLLQFIPSTADQIARELGLSTKFDDTMLYNPKVSIQFGSQYLSDLFKLFPNMPQAVSAAYNGGEDNVSRWLTRSRTTDPDRYVCEVGFSQSKDYIFKVVANFDSYQELYTVELQTASAASK